MSTRRVCVVGGGVIGVSTALHVLENVPNVTVTIVAERMTPDTTSDVAAGLWEPHMFGNTPIDKVKRWGDATFDHLVSIADSSDADVLGVSYTSGYNLSENEIEDPFWSETVRGYRPMTSTELKTFSTDYKFKDRGGTLSCKKVASFNELKNVELFQLKNDYDAIVNCTGVGARELCQDFSLVPVRGQVTRVQAPWLKHYVIDMSANESTYILISQDYVVLGGSNNIGDFNLNVNLSEKQGIKDRCAKLIPSLKHAKEVGDFVGLRPTRPEVRLERENMLSHGTVIKVIHNYGHGGAGVSLHWGCAREAARLVQQALDDSISARL